MKIGVFFCVNLAIIASGCITSPKGSGCVYNNSDLGVQLQIESEKEYCFYLDSTTSPIISYCKYLDSDGNMPLFSFINEWNNTIYYYDDESKHVCSRQSFNASWPVQGYEIHKDTLILYNYDREEIFVSFAGGMDGVWSIKNSEEYPNTLYPAPNLMTRSPLLLMDGSQIVMPLFSPAAATLEEEKDRKALRILDFRTGVIKERVPFPKEIQEMDFGGGLTYLQPYIEKGHSNQIVVSFSFSHDLYVYDIVNDTYESHYAGSSRIRKINSFEGARKLGDSQFSPAWEWYMRNPSYEGVLYDRYRHCYYRIARLPLPRGAQIASFGNNKPVVVIVLDESFNYLGEASLSQNEAYNPFCSFVSTDGLMIQVMNGSEDELCFHGFHFEL